MDKVFLIIKREYLTRVRKKSFIIMTLLGPILMGGLIALSVYLSINQGSSTERIQIIDETPGKIFQTNLRSDARLIIEPTKLSLDSARKNFKSDEYYGILYISSGAVLHPDSFTFYSDKKVSPAVVMNLEQKLQNEFENYNLKNSGIDTAVLNLVQNKNVSITTRQNENDTEQVNAGITAVIGFAGGLMIYMFIFMYGIQVMRGVMEEKTNRIVEVIISSVKPQQLMMGKILGVSLVGLTQFLLWIILTFGVSTIATTVIATNNKSTIEKMTQLQTIDQSGMKQQQLESSEFDISKIMGTINIPKILLSFLFYFLGGFLIYAALFAAIGAAVDSETDTQQFMLPVTLPLIFAYIASIGVMQNPDSTLGYWCSLFPLTSPIVMMVRMPFDPPIIDLVISMLLLIAGFIGTTWLASKIYSVGILMYGKKITYRELAKWLTYKV